MSTYGSVIKTATCRHPTCRQAIEYRIRDDEDFGDPAGRWVHTDGSVVCPPTTTAAPDLMTIEEMRSHA